MLMGAPNWMFQTDLPDDIISNSLRFNDGDSAHLTFTPGSANGQTRCTIAAWVKRCNLGAEHNIFHAGTASGNRGHLRFNSDDTLEWAYYNGSSWILDVNTNAKYRDTTNWYHIVARLDTTDGTADIYVNGTIQTLQTSTKPSSSQNTSFGENVEHQIGERGYSTTGYFDGYLADVNFINGTDLTASSFGREVDGVWIPKNISGLTFGDNGFRLQFKQTGTGTASASTIGADTSGETNHFTSANLVASDVVTDTPDNNFATGIGPLSESQDSKSYYQATWSEGNLKATGSSSGWSNGMSNFGVNYGKWYAEILVNSWNGSGYVRIGLTARPDRTYDEYFVLGDGTGQLDASARNGRLPSFTTGDVIQFALDLENNAFYLGKNGTWGNSATTTEIENGTTTNAFASGAEVPTSDGCDYYFYAQPHSTGTSLTWNFGQDDTFVGEKTSNGVTGGGGKFRYAPPAGFNALCSKNLEEPIFSANPNRPENADDNFIPYSYTADNTDNKARTGVGFKPDLLWFKDRTTAFSNTVYDSSRGANKYIQSNNTNAENTSSDLMSSFDSDGFTTQNDGSSGNLLNYSTDKYIVWSWKANGGTTTTNDASATGIGSIDSTYQANTDAGFSIVSYTGTGSEAQIAHGLSQAPNMVIIKNRSSSPNGQWVIGHTSVGFSKQAYMDTGSFSTNSGSFNNTAPTSTTVNVNTDNTTNESGDSFIMYCFHSVEGYSKFGTYTGNGNADGTYIHLGFKPALFVAKSTGTEAWVVMDNARPGYNPTGNYIFWNHSNAEGGAGSEYVDLLSNGVKLRTTGASANGSATFIYMAWAEAPFKYSNAA